MQNFFWNRSVAEIMERYMAQISSTKKIDLPFLLRYGPNNIGKSTLAQYLIGQLLGPFKASDFLYIKDCSEVIGKRHSLKISTPKTEDIIDLPDGTKYEDFGVREMNEWLVKSSLSGFKVVLLENIERLTGDAANALLKNLEEPLAGRLIIATTSNHHKVLETILSRATLIWFQDLTEQESRQALNFLMPIGDEKVKEHILTYTMGKPWLMAQVIEKISSEEWDHESNSDLIEQLQKPRNIASLVKMFQKIIDQGMLDHVLKVLIQYYTIHQEYEKVGLLIETLKKTSTNVKSDHLVFELLLKR